MAALWDALSGKIYRWNKTKNDAFEDFLGNLRELQLSAERECPEGLQHFLLLRDFEVAYYSAWQICFSNLLYDNGEDLREPLYSLNSRSMNVVMAAFNFHFVFLRHGSSEERRAFMLLFFMAKHLFAKPEGYFQGWLDTFDWHDSLSDNGALVARYNHKLYEEIAPLMGLPTDDMSVLMGGMRMFGLSLAVAETATHVVKKSSWRRVVDDWVQGRR